MRFCEGHQIAGLLKILPSSDPFTLDAISITLKAPYEELGEIDMGHPEKYVIPGPALTLTFSSFRILRHLDLGIPFSLANDDLLQLCTSLPQIVSLSLCSSPEYFPEHFIPQTTITSLSFCASRCQYLENLDLMIDATQPSFDLLKTSTSPLTFLNVGTSWISPETVTPMAEAIDKLLLALQEFRHSVEQPEDDSVVWDPEQVVQPAHLVKAANRQAWLWALIATTLKKEKPGLEAIMG